MYLLLAEIKRALDKQTATGVHPPQDKLLYQYLFEIIRDAITGCGVPAGCLLPSTRLLSKELGVSRCTVIKAYELLALNKLIETIPGSGNRVSKNIVFNVPHTRVVKETIYPGLSRSCQAFLSHTTIIEGAGDSPVAFRRDLPPLDIFPLSQWNRLTNNYWKHIKASELNHVSTSGTWQLKESIAAYLRFTRKLECDPGQIIIVTGSLQSIYTICKVFLNPDDWVYMENPSFPNVISILKAHRANIYGVDTDQKGMVVDQLNQPELQKPKIVFTVPSCNYPTGSRMSLDRRMELVKWISDNNAIVIEDELEHEVNNYNDLMPSLFSLDKEQRVFFLGTFNIILHPAIRVAYMVIPQPLANTINTILEHTHRFVSPSTQLILSRFLDEGHIYKHIINLVKTAQARKEVFCREFARHFGQELIIKDGQARSLYLLAELTGSIEDKHLVRNLSENGILSHPYSRCFIGKPAGTGLILGYSSVRESEMREKLVCMKKHFQAYVKCLRHPINQPVIV